MSNVHSISVKRETFSRMQRFEGHCDQNRESDIRHYRTECCFCRFKLVSSPCFNPLFLFLLSVHARFALLFCFLACGFLFLFYGWVAGLNDEGNFNLQFAIKSPEGRSLTSRQQNEGTRMSEKETVHFPSNVCVCVALCVCVCVCVCVSVVSMWFEY